MRTKYFAIIAAIMTAGGAAWAGSSEPFGLAESKTGYQIGRDSAIVKAKGDTLTRVELGDRLTAVAAPVRVQASSGDTILLQPNASAEFDKTKSVNVLSGDVLVAIARDSKTDITFDDVVISPLTESGKSGPQHLVDVNRIDESRVQITGYNHPLAVKKAGGAEQLAVLGNQDKITLVKTSKGWVVAEADQPTEVTDSPADQNGEEPQEKEERRGVLGWFLSPVGLIVTGGLIAGAAVGVGVGLSGGGDNGNNNGGNKSRINSPPPPGGAAQKTFSVSLRP